MTAALAEPAREFYIEQALDRYYNVPPDARALALAGSSVPSARDSAAVYGNPAGLAFVKAAEVGLTGGRRELSGDEDLRQTKIVQETDSLQLLAAVPLRVAEPTLPAVTVGLGFLRYQGETDDTITTMPDGHQRTIAFGGQPSAGFGLGYSFTFFDDELRSDLADYHSHSRLRHTVGAQYSPEEHLVLGAVLFAGLGQSDFEEFAINSNAVFHSDQYGAQGGFSYRIGLLNVAGSVDYQYYANDGKVRVESPQVVVGTEEEGHEFNVRAGTEYAVTQRLTGRFGVRYGMVNDYRFRRAELAHLSGDLTYLGCSGGAGFVLFGEPTSPWAFLDYGAEFRDLGRGEWQHLVTLRVLFGRDHR